MDIGDERINNDGVTDNSIQAHIQFGSAVAYYHDNGLISLVADNADFAGAIRALVELADEIMPNDSAVNAAVKGLQKL